jgi:hypothetical protein
MHNPLLAALQDWTNFYVIVGSSAGALTGLQFVVMALIAQVRAGGSMHDVQAFGSPTIVDFCAALFISATVAAPWQNIAAVAWVLKLTGAAGVLYSLNSIRHALKPTGYTPDAEDWTWYVGLPLIAYVGLFVSGLRLQQHPEGTLFAIAAVALSLLFIGIRNSWDSVTYIVMAHAHRRDVGRETDKAA